MLTVDYDLLDVHPGHTVLDLGCGAGRHTFASLRRGASTVSADLEDSVLKDVGAMVDAMRLEREIAKDVRHVCVSADALDLPFADRSFDRVIASEVLEHIPEDSQALREIARVLRPGGRASVTVPRFGPEIVNWILSKSYRESAGGHVRIYRRGQLRERLHRAGLVVLEHHHAHALHSPYWWLRSIVGIDRADHPLVSAYHRFLVWDIETANPIVRTTERALDPILGKSFAIYAEKPR